MENQLGIQYFWLSCCGKWLIFKCKPWRSCKETEMWRRNCKDIITSCNTTRKSRCHSSTSALLFNYSTIGTDWMTNVTSKFLNASQFCMHCDNWLIVPLLIACRPHKFPWIVQILRQAVLTSALWDVEFYNLVWYQDQHKLEMSSGPSKLGLQSGFLTTLEW